ncbi:calcium/sodium antiporter [Romeria aff. gracilis LEGE 07310]|uniref:Calcium/sodium antiporter n=1 Tax=Vasconcelosia minhoensis LEGE 07310 TaxID=915328 RepID=A0A8J7AHM2_9CYAN|nr:calcium/sodium antiporter [Romeria gracilis]MBE9079109.1 calcium/sodium antiporter [Romeria aff. gracilis LEGE 07310]
MNITSIVLLVIGLVLLVLGAELLVRGASRLAALVGISSLVIGLTVVAFGTSAPELAVSLRASFSGQADIALGNVVGSNICNILLILGISSLIAPLIVAQQLVRLDVPIMIGVSILMLVFGLDGAITTSDGTILFIGGIVYTLFLVFQSRRETNPIVQDEYARYSRQPFSLKSAGVNLLFFLVGMGLLVTGSNMLVDNAVDIATALGASPLVVGLTIVAFGTSLPELATSLIASIRGERDIAVGNVVGSNIFNILIVLGLTSALSPTGISVSNTAITFDIPIMVAVSIMCFPIVFTGNSISRWEGGLLLSYYITYTIYLILHATDAESSIWVGAILRFVVVPLTLLVLGTMTWRSWRLKRQRRAAERAGDRK